jgi:Spy/CpxP family protein refolding chaperone
MKLFGCVALALMMFVAGQADGQVQVQNQRVQRIQDVFGRGASGPLVSKETQEKLNLTAEQKDKIDKLEKEFADKTKDTETKIREAREKAIQDKNREAFAKIREMTTEAQKVRTDYEDKVKGVLNDEQKKQFEEAARAGRRPGIDALRVPFGRNADSQGLQSKDVQEKLGLSAEQKEKLEKLQKEFESRSQEVLTDEQKKKFEELKKQPARRPVPGNG